MAIHDKHVNDQVLVMLDDELWTPPVGLVYAGGLPESEEQVMVVGWRGPFSLAITEVGAWFFDDDGDLKDDQGLAEAYQAMLDI